MGRLLIEDTDGARRALLVTSTLLGRHWRCDARLQHPSVPLYWLEVRWSGSHWAWRCLGAEDHTRGKGPADPRGWRRLGANDEVALPLAGVRVRMADETPPQVVLQDLDTHRWIDGDARFEVLALTADGPRALGSAGELSAAVLTDGAELHHGGRRLRVHVPEGQADTELGTLSLEAGPVEMDFDLSIPAVVLSGKGGELRLTGSLVRTLALYAAAHTHTGCRGGWLSNTQAHTWAQHLGAASDAPPERLNWERARLRSRLLEAGLGGVDTFFERQREAGVWFHRMRRVPRVSGLPVLPAPDGMHLPLGLTPDPIE